MGPHESDEETQAEQTENVSHMPTAEKVETVRKENNGRLILSEEEALAWCRGHPQDKESIYIVWSRDDKENPRNWGHARKYYVSVFASLLNTVT